MRSFIGLTLSLSKGVETRVVLKFTAGSLE